MKIWGERNAVGDFKGGSIETATEHPFTVYWLELTWLPLEAGKYLYSGKPCTQVKTYHHRRKKRTDTVEQSASARAGQSAYIPNQDKLTQNRHYKHNRSFFNVVIL